MGSLELLDQTLILAHMDQQARSELTGLEVKAKVDSTNSAVQRMPVADQHGMAVLAEQQSAGRGRRGRYWHSPYAKNLYLSLGWRFEQNPAELGCLPLVLAVAAAQAVQRAGLKGHMIKWPNDLLLSGRKFCGCLVEVQGDTCGPCHAVLGVGINVHMPVSNETAGIDQPWTDLQTHLPDCSRNQLAGLLLEEMISSFSIFTEQGFAPFKDRWSELDVLEGKQVKVKAGERLLSGQVTGIDSDGALLLDTGVEILRLHSGEVSIMQPC